MKHLRILLFFLVPVLLFSQTDVKQEGLYYYQNQDYFNAVYFLEMAYDQDSTDFKVWYPLAQSYTKTNQHKKSFYLYQKIWNIDQGLNYPLALYWLGLNYKSLGDYENASDHLRDFINSYMDTDDIWYQRSIVELKGAELAKLLTPQDIEINSLPQPINSKESDFSPFPTDSVLYFSSLTKSDGRNTEEYLGHHSKIYTVNSSKKVNEFRFLNSNDFHVGNISFNPDQSQLFFTKCKTETNKMICQIYTSFLNNDIWSNPTLMSSAFNPPLTNNTHPQWALWNDKEGLFVASNREGGFGDLDIWFISMDEQVYNVGGAINTKGNEVTPFYHSIEEKLYFSSDFHPSIGGYDIFENKWDGRWNQTKNVGIPLNSSNNDLYYISSLTDPLSGYLSSNRIGSLFIKSESCCNDIYQFKKSDYCICQEQDSLVQEMQLLLPLQLYFHNDEPNPKSLDSITSLSYSHAYNSFYELKNLYIQKFSSPLNGNLKSQSEREMKGFFDQKVKQGYNQLNLFAFQLVEAMEIGAKIELNLIGFASPLNDTQYNQNLSKRRISSVYNFLSVFEGGVLLPYIQNGRIKINELPMGESKASREVSDNPNNRRLSVYSINAATERRIEIQSIFVEF
jgi:tetratricopeptide (TPR) repeat protein